MSNDPSSSSTTTTTVAAAPAPATTSSTTTTTTSETKNNMKNGIDIRQALEILAARTPHQHGGSGHIHDNDNGKNGQSNSKDGQGHDHDHGCCCGGGGGGGSSGTMPESSREILRTMGQTIDLLAPSKAGAAGATTTTKSNDGMQPGQEQNLQTDIVGERDLLQSSSSKDNTKNISNDNNDTTEKEKKDQKKEQIKEHLATMSVVDLLQTVLSSQEERVKTYRTYEQALEQVLVSGNLTNYPPACATATASFAVLSDTIRAVQQELERRVSDADTSTADVDADADAAASQCHRMQWKEEAQNIAKLQSLEREKLQLTAACHLERIRERNQREELNSSNGSRNGSEGRILSLLQDGITNLQTKVRSCTEQINEVLQEVRCALVEEMEGGDEDS